MKIKYIAGLILCLILSLSVILAHAVKPSVSAAAASPQDTDPLRISLSSGKSWSTDKSSDDLFMAYMPIVSRLQRVGERLNIYDSGSQTFPAGSPFHIVHGWTLDSLVDQPELFDFQLQVDGVYREADIIEMRPGESRLYVFNFAAGMTGMHTLTGHWLLPCWAISEECTDPDQILETNTSNVLVTFIP